jgi:hypothetical protein
MQVQCVVRRWLSGVGGFLGIDRNRWKKKKIRLVRGFELASDSLRLIGEENLVLAPLPWLPGQGVCEEKKVVAIGIEPRTYAASLDS